MAVAQRSRGPVTQPWRRAVSGRNGHPPVLPGDRRRSAPETEEGHDLLATIELEIVPRLMLAHRADPLSPALCSEFRPPPSAAEVSAFARIATCQDLGGAIAFVESLCRQGLSLEEILLDLVAPAARLLGDQWLADLRTFTEVSTGLGTLQQVVHILGPSFAPALPHRGLVVLVAAPGEQHTLGLYLVGEFLRRAGWGVEIDPAMSRADLLALIASEWVEMLGISVSNDHLLAPLTSMIEAVMAASRNPTLTVMLGGAPKLADFAARHDGLIYVPDARGAVRWLETCASLRGCSN